MHQYFDEHGKCVYFFGRHMRLSTYWFGIVFIITTGDGLCLSYTFRDMEGGES
jgi:hypothetical protein